MKFWSFESSPHHVRVWPSPRYRREARLLFFSHDDATQLRWILFRPVVVLDLWWACFLKQLLPESTLLTSFFSKSLSDTFCNGAYLVHYQFKFVSRQPLLYRPASQITIIFCCSDLYHLGLSNDPPYRKALVYGVYAAEVAQTILYSKMGFQEFASGFGNILALEEIGLLWFAAPILTAIGVYNPYLCHFPLAYE